jgi:hypothetical protein
MPNDFKREYAFTLTAALRQRVIGEVPGGTRVDLAYLNQGASTIVARTGGIFPAGATGKILSGQDWVMVTENGVADFDGRFTADCNGVLLGAHVQGRADMSTVVVDGQPIGKNPYERWRTGFGTGATLTLILPVVFDIADQDLDSARAQGTAPPGDAPAGAGAEGHSATPSPEAPDLGKLELLGRSMALAEGVVTFTSGPYSPIESITLDVYCYRPKRPEERVKSSLPATDSLVGAVRTGRGKRPEAQESPYVPSGEPVTASEQWDR